VQLVAFFAGILSFSQAVAADKVLDIPVDSAKQQMNVVTVSARGGDFSDPVAAVHSITNATAANPYLVLISHGEYTLARTLKMKPYVTVAGSGRDSTILTGAISSDANQADATSALVAGADNTTLSDLTIENTGGRLYSVALYNRDCSPIIHNVTAIASGGTSFGVFNFSSSPKMTGVKATASGGKSSRGVYNHANSSPTMTDVTAIASGGKYNYGVYNSWNSSARMTHVTATASGGDDNIGVYNSWRSSVRMTDVTATASGGMNNYSVYNDGSTTSMTDVTATASGGMNNYSVFNSWNSTASMTDVTAIATGEDDNIGVYNSWNSSMTLTDVTAAASGGRYNYRVYNDDSSIIMTDVTAAASGKQCDDSMVNDDFSTTIRHCTLAGNYYGIYVSRDATGTTQPPIGESEALYSGIPSGRVLDKGDTSVNRF
jgi:hypothetical protein